MIAALLGSLLPWLAGALGGLVVLAAAYWRGRSDRDADAAAARDRDALKTRAAIDEASRNAPTDPDAARRALAERLRRRSTRE